jgi:RND family efflux transporter MFP subunit
MSQLSTRSRWIIIFTTTAAFVAANSVVMSRRHMTRLAFETVTVMPMPLIVRASGTLEPKDSNTVKAQFDGAVIAKSFREGQVVKAGDLLLVLSREKIKVDHQNKTNDLTNAKSELMRSRKDLRIQKELYRKEAVAYSSVEDAERALVKAQQALHVAEEAYRQADAQWKSSQMVAPISGTVVKDWIGDDKTVAANKEVFTVADVSSYTVKAHVDELDIKQVSEGQKADVTLQVYGATPLSAVVKEIGSTPEGTGLPEIAVVLAITDTRGLLLRPKLSAEANILTGVTEPILSVPTNAVDNTKGESRVWVLGALHRIYPATVAVGRSNPDRIEIARGLRAGQKVAVSAEPDFAPGMRVIEGRAMLEPRAFSHSKTHVLMSQLKHNEKDKARDRDKNPFHRVLLAKPRASSNP